MKKSVVEFELNEARMNMLATQPVVVASLCAHLPKSLLFHIFLFI